LVGKLCAGWQPCLFLGERHSNVPRAHTLLDRERFLDQRLHRAAEATWRAPNISAGLTPISRSAPCSTAITCPAGEITMIRTRYKRAVRRQVKRFAVRAMNLGIVPSRFKNYALSAEVDSVKREQCRMEQVAPSANSLVHLRSNKAFAVGWTMKTGFERTLIAGAAELNPVLEELNESLCTLERTRPFRERQSVFGACHCCWTIRRWDFTLARRHYE
jgi:hypothetical protein